MNHELDDEVRRQLEESKATFIKGVAAAQRWLHWQQAALAYYQEWLRDPDLTPPDHPFPSWRER